MAKSTKQIINIAWLYFDDFVKTDEFIHISLGGFNRIGDVYQITINYCFEDIPQNLFKCVIELTLHGHNFIRCYHV